MRLGVLEIACFWCLTIDMDLVSEEISLDPRESKPTAVICNITCHQ